MTDAVTDAAMRPVGAGCSSLPARRAVAQHMGGGSFFGGSEAFTILRESRQVATFTAIRTYPVSHFYRFTYRKHTISLKRGGVKSSQVRKAR